MRESVRTRMAGWLEDLRARRLEEFRAPDERPMSSGRLLASVVLAGFVALRLWDPAPLAELRYQVFDAYQRLAPRSVTESTTVIVDIDDASLERFGQWPWPRSLLATLVDRLFAAGARAVALDVNLPEPDRLSPPALAESLPDLDEVSRDLLRRHPSNDTTLAAALAAGPTVVAEAVLTEDSGGPGIDTAPGERAGLAEIGGDPRTKLANYPFILTTIPELRAAAGGIGVNSFSIDRDGVVRRVALLFQVNGRLLPALPLELIRVASGDPQLLIRSDEQGIASVTTGGVTVPTDPTGQAWLHFTRPPGATYVSAATLLEEGLDLSTANLSAIDGKLVLVGSSAIGLKDIQTTPIAEAMPGVEILAQAVDAMIAGATLARPRAPVLVELALLLVVAALIIVIVPRLGAWGNAALGAALVVVLIGGSWLLYTGVQTLVDWSLPLLGAGVVNFCLVFVEYAEEQRVRRAAQQRLLLFRQEMEAAERVQRSILPQRFPERPDLEIYAEMWPAREVGGDFFDIFELAEGRLGFVIADVSGKGMSAALFMAISRTLLKAEVQVLGDPSACVGRVNDILSDDNEACMFVTLFYGVFDPAAGVLRYANGGHNPPYILRDNGSVDELPSAKGIALGVLAGFPFATEEIRLGPGDSLLMYTDGVTEAFSPSGEEFTERRLIELLRGQSQLQPTPLVQLVVRTIKTFVNTEPQPDDITCMAVKYLGNRL